MSCQVVAPTLILALRPIVHVSMLTRICTESGLHREQADTGLDTLSKGVSAALGPPRGILFS